MPDTHTVDKLIDLKRHIAGSASARFVQMIEAPLEKMLCVSAVNHMYKCLQHQQAETFFGRCIDFLNVAVRVNDGDLERIPRSGPLVVVCNHPFGALDGIILGWLLSRVRRDVKIIGNYFLHQIPEIQHSIIPVDPFQGNNAAIRNLAPMKNALSWLRGGGAIGMFPAGEVSHWDSSARRITDPAWSPHAAAFIQHTRAVTLPVYFSGRNSLFYQLMGMVHPMIRTAMLPRELIKKKSSEIPLTIGRPIPYSAIEHMDSRSAVTRYLRLHTYLLGRRNAGAVCSGIKRTVLRCRPAGCAPVISAVPRDILAAEIGSLPGDRMLLRHAHMHVYAVEKSGSPAVLREIGRLREESFRAVSEGTGRSCDLDAFDDYYQHIFLWDAALGRIAGAYRVGHSDDILSRHGRKGLYTSTLFDIKRDFFRQLGPALELGRSFISPDYQKQYNALATLWKGIGQYVVRNPRYGKLFGPVSISNDYHRVSKDLMLSFLRCTRTHADLSQCVRARNPVRAFRRLNATEVFDELTFDNISAMIADIEHDGKGLPVLLRHYLKLHAAIVDFNIDPSFSRVIDGLLVVDLLKTDSRLLQRFLGQQGLSAFMSHHDNFAL
jgi:putative hemolysin